MSSSRDLVLHDCDLDLSTSDGRARLHERRIAILRLRNFGTPPEVIADKLDMSLRDVESILTHAFREMVNEDAREVAGRQQATLNDMRQAIYDAMMAGDPAAIMALLKVMDHESKLHGVYAPQRIKVGMDHDEFVSTAVEDLRALGVDVSGDTPLSEEDGESWANT